MTVMWGLSACHASSVWIAPNFVARLPYSSMREPATGEIGCLACSQPLPQQSVAGAGPVQARGLGVCAPECDPQRDEQAQAPQAGQRAAAAWLGRSQSPHSGWHAPQGCHSPGMGGLCSQCICLDVRMSKLDLTALLSAVTEPSFLSGLHMLETAPAGHEVAGIHLSPCPVGSKVESACELSLPSSMLQGWASARRLPLVRIGKAAGLEPPHLLTERPHSPFLEAAAPAGPEQLLPGGGHHAQRRHRAPAQAGPPRAPGSGRLLPTVPGCPGAPAPGAGQPAG